VKISTESNEAKPQKAQEKMNSKNTSRWIQTSDIQWTDVRSGIAIRVDPTGNWWILVPNDPKFHNAETTIAREAMEKAEKMEVAGKDSPAATVASNPEFTQAWVDLQDALRKVAQEAHRPSIPCAPRQNFRQHIRKASLILDRLSEI
jgi:hypothetical protein